MLELALELGELRFGAHDLRTLEMRTRPAEVVHEQEQDELPAMNGHEMLPEVGNEKRTIRTMTQKIAT